MNTNPFLKQTLPLVFGCSHLSGGRQTRQSLRLVETAFDSGIRAFDVARMYMSGEAEEVLGHFIPKHRDELIITTKAGIQPPPYVKARKWLRRASKVAHMAINTPIMAEDNYQYHKFDIPSLRQSVTTSLKKMRLEYIDALLLHEADIADIADGKVLDFLAELKHQGKIRCCGLASTRDQTKEILAKPNLQMQIVQTANTVFDGGLLPIGDISRYFTITHSVLSGALARVVGRLAADNNMQNEWALATQTDPRNSEIIAELLLAEALETNRNGMVIFSTKTPSRIASAVRVAREQPYSAEQLWGVRSVCAKI